jgi:hypothetical protein
MKRILRIRRRRGKARVDGHGSWLDIRPPIKGPGKGRYAEQWEASSGQINQTWRKRSLP